MPVKIIKSVVIPASPFSIEKWTHEIRPDLPVLYSPAFEVPDKAFIQVQPVNLTAGTVWAFKRSDYAYVARVVGRDPFALVQLTAFMLLFVKNAGVKILLSKPVPSAENFNHKMGFKKHPIFHEFLYSTVYDLEKLKILSRYLRDFSQS